MKQVLHQEALAAFIEWQNKPDKVLFHEPLESRARLGA